jgi:DNA-binding transcriptional LysR family regulator
MVEQRHARLSIGIADTLLPVFMPNFVGGFVEAHPEILLSLKTFPLTVCQSEVEKQKLQIGIVPGPVDTEHFSAFLLRRLMLCIAVGKKHPFAKRKSIKLVCGGLTKVKEIPPERNAGNPWAWRRMLFLWYTRSGKGEM